MSLNMVNKNIEDLLFYEVLFLLQSHLVCYKLLYREFFYVYSTKRFFEPVIKTCLPAFYHVLSKAFDSFTIIMGLCTLLISSFYTGTKSEVAK